MYFKLKGDVNRFKNKTHSCFCYKIKQIVTQMNECINKYEEVLCNM